MINNFLSSTIWLSSNTICLRKSGSKWNSFLVLFRVMKMYPSNLQRWPIDFVGFSHLKYHGLLDHLSLVWFQSTAVIIHFDILTTLSPAPAFSDPTPGWPQLPGCPLLHFSCCSPGTNYVSKQGFLLVGKCLGNTSLSASESSLLLILSKYRAGKHGLFKEKNFILLLIFLIQVRYYTLFT